MQQVRLLLLLLLVPLFACGQNVDTRPAVYLILKDCKSKDVVPLEVISVLVPSPENALIRRYPDPQGNRFVLPHPGKYILSVKCSGYYGESFPVIADSGKTDTCEVLLCEDLSQEIWLPGPEDINVPHSSDDPSRNPGSAKTKNTGGKLVFPAEHDSAWMGIDSFALSGIRHASKDQLATSLFRTAKLYRFNDTTWYFHKAYCPGYAIYYQRGNGLYAAEPFCEKRVPRQIVFRKTRKGYMLKSDWGTSVLMEKL